MKTVLIHPTAGARRATRRTALAAALLLASSTLAVSVPQQADAGGAQACTSAFPTAAAAPKLVNGVYEIASEANLVFLSANANEIVAGGSDELWREQDFLQTDHINLEGCEFTSIGRDPDVTGGYVPFDGTYDGGGHTITGLRIDEKELPNVGLFAHADDATLRNIHLVEPQVVGGAVVGGLAGQLGASGANRGLVENVSISGGSIESKEDMVGGVIGQSWGSIRDAHFSGAVLAEGGYSAAGGVAGESLGEIRRSSASGTVTGTGDSVGGLVGGNWGGSITNSWSTADVRGAAQVGGLVGADGSITDSYATGEVTGTRDGVGGLVGQLFSTSTITNSYATGDVEGQDDVGGLVGDNNGGSIVASFSTSDVDGRNRVGGLIGLHRNSGTITNAYATGDVSGENRVGGLVGEIAAGMTNVFSVGRVTGDENVGGLIGDEDDDELDIIAAFWDVGTSLIGASGDDNFGATGRTTAEMTSFATFDAAWNSESTTVIVEGWQALSNPTWGICAAVNGGYPFLLWQSDSDPCSTTVTTPTTVASTPVLIGGVVPEVPAGQGVWQRADGTSTPLVASSPAAGQLRYAAEGVRVTLTGTAASSPARGLVADPAGEIVCEVCVAASAGQVIEVWMFSTPRLVAAHRIDDTECHLLAIPLSAPLDGQGAVSAGAHTLQLAIPTSSGMQAVNVGVTVGGLVPTRIPAGDGPVPSGAVLLALFAAAGVVVAGRRLVTAG